MTMTTHDHLMNLKYFLTDKLELFLFYMLKKSYLCTMIENPIIDMRKFLPMERLKSRMPTSSVSKEMVLELLKQTNKNYHYDTTRRKK